MRLLLALLLVAVIPLGTGTQIVSTSHRKVAYGWGCGGNCAVNISGESETALGNDPPDVHLEDHGTLTQKQTDPGGMMINTKRWKYAFHGASRGDDSKREYDLYTDVSECTRSSEIAEASKNTISTPTDCGGPPKQWKLACERSEVQVKDRARPAWVCSPADHMDAFGTEFPWVFGIEESITTVVSGEPHPHTTYE
jgi:hypothetical protein